MTAHLNVMLAENAGACYGVQRALKMAEEAAEGSKPAFTLGSLIHNPIVVARLEEQGVRVADDLGQLDADATVIIRSHGVAPQVRAEIAARGLEAVDATCPHVARAQKAAAELAEQGCHVIVVGEDAHPEVESLKAYAQQAGARVDVVASPDGLPADLEFPVGVVVQTTQRRENLDAVVAAIKAKGVEPVVRQTICRATRERQDAAAELSHMVDAMVVIGGRNSSNTTRLAEICAASCPATYHIESAGELDPAWFAKCATVGVTAGASTPEDQIAAVVACLESM